MGPTWRSNDRERDTHPIRFPIRFWKEGLWESLNSTAAGPRRHWKRPPPRASFFSSVTNLVSSECFCSRQGLAHTLRPPPCLARRMAQPEAVTSWEDVNVEQLESQLKKLQPPSKAMR